MKLFILFAFTFCASLAASAQGGAAVGSRVADFGLPRILNHSRSSGSFSTMKGRITLVDFFGTWCSPCIRALPHLKDLQEAYAGKVVVLLVSIEEEEKLRNFVQTRQPFPFPLAIDSGEVITALFQPPSYPYTVVLAADGTVLATVTDAAQLTPAAIDGWLNRATVDAVENGALTTSKTIAMSPLQKSTNAVVRLSQEWVYSAKTAAPLDSLQAAFQTLPFDALKQSLGSEAEKKAFWINLYNGNSYALLSKNPEAYKKRGRFFRKKQISLAGMSLSLDEIEHDFLRRSKIKWSLGYLSKPFPSRTAKGLRVQRVDYRIHFALNCGAKSCPPIAYYNSEGLDAQLDAATRAYLGSEARYDSASNRLYLPKLISWFRGDFGGKKGIKKLVRTLGILPPNKNPKFVFTPYDWTLKLNP